MGRKSNIKRRIDSARLMSMMMCALLLVIALIPTFTVSAAEAENKPPKIRVGYYENEVFQEGASENAVKTGYAYEYYRKISEYTGWEYEYVYGSYNDLYQMLLDGKIDLLAGLAWKQERVGLIGYPDAPMGSEAYNLVKHNSAVDISAAPASMNGKTFGVLKSAIEDVLRRYLDENKIKANVVVFDDYDELFKSFDAGKIDILAAEGDGAYGRSHAEFLTTFGESDYYLCVNVKKPELLEKLNTAQAFLKAEEPNYINSLNEKYYPVTVSARAFSEREKEWLDTHSELRIGYLENFLPCSDTDDNGNAIGMVKDLFPQMFKELGITNIKDKYYGYKNYDDMIADLTSGKIDVAFPIGGGLYYSEESGIYQSAPVVSSITELIYKGNYDEDKAPTFAVNENNRMQYYYVMVHYPDADITYYPSIEGCLQAVVDGEVNYTVLNGLRVNEILKNSAYKDLSSAQSNKVDEHCIGVKIGNDGLLKLMNRGISIIGSNSLQDYPIRYAEELYHYGLGDVIRKNIVLFVSSFVCIAALVILLLVRNSHRQKKDAQEKLAVLNELEERNRELSENRSALAGALASAEQASRAKTTFLNNMSHDIRTPMNAIIGFTALAGSHIDDKEQVLEYLEKISISSQHLLSLINDVLDMSRIESGKVTIDETMVHLPDVVRDLRTIIQPNVSAKRLELFIDTQDVVHEDIITDKMRLNQVLLNILSNAIKFTPDGGMISFRLIEKPSLSKDYASFEFHIKDNGIGMSDEFQKVVFDSFTREKNSTVSGIQGTGLGMAITKNIVDMMGGTISVKSKIGKGTEFVVSISCKVSAEPAQPEPIPELQGLRALVADDDTDTCLSICSMLHEIGMRPDWTNYGKEAVIRTKEAYDRGDEFSVYIIDWMMPDQNGIETVRRIRRIIGDSTPIIILTAYDYSDIEAEAREAGVTAFCSKPLFMSELRQILSHPLLAKNDPCEQNKDDSAYIGKRILLAEDNEMNQMIAVAILKDHGMEVDIAGDGIETVEKVESAPAGYYDVILMDIQMPHMNGYEAAKVIRAMDDKEKANIPIVAVTANAFEEDRINALNAGMNDHMAKPYDIPTILEMLNKLFCRPEGEK